MRVIHISPTAFGSDGLFGGGERYPVELARAVARIIDCELVTFGSRPPVRQEGPLAIRVLEAKTRAGGHSAHPLGRGVVTAVGRADIVHVHHLRALPSRVAAIAAAALGKKRVVTDHGLGAGRWPRADATLFDHFLTVSRYSAETLAASAAKTTTIYGGADTDRFHPITGAHREGVLFVGRLTPHKGIDRLIAALPSGASLTIAGTSGHDQALPERDYPDLLRRLGRGRDVDFVGSVAENELPALYRHARVLVLPTVSETYYGKRVAIPELLGPSLLEAMASGTPVIASDLGGLPEVVVDGVTGFVVPAADIAMLRDRIERLLADDALWNEMSENARAHVQENFTWDRVAARCVSVYEGLMAAE